jgi:hypothetical protein
MSAGIIENGQGGMRSPDGSSAVLLYRVVQLDAQDASIVFDNKSHPLPGPLV